MEVWSIADNTPAVLAADTTFSVSIKQNRTNLSDATTIEDDVASDIVEQAALVNTNDPAGAAIEPIDQGGEVQETVVSSLASSFEDVIDLTGLAFFEAGQVLIDWVDGVFQIPASILWYVGRYAVVDANNTATVLTTFGVNPASGGYTTEAEAKTAAATLLRHKFTLLAGYNLAIRNIDYNASNVNGTPTPTFLFNPGITVPLTYTTTQHGLNNS